MAKESKSRYWVGVGYLDNMVDGWQDRIGDIVELPYAYCVHDKDLDKDGDCRKPHVHIILAWTGGTTTYSHALSTFNCLSVDPKKRPAFNKCEVVRSIRNKYNYLIHDTEAAKKAGKYLYPDNERITGNNFDIGAYEQLSSKEKNDMAKELCDIIITENIINFADFYMYATSNYGMEYFDIIKTYSGLFERIIKGNYHKKITDSVKGDQA